MGEQKTLVQAKREVRTPGSSSSSLPVPLHCSGSHMGAGSDVSGILASVLPLHYKHTLSPHSYQQRALSKGRRQLLAEVQAMVQLKTTSCADQFGDNTGHLLIFLGSPEKTTLYPPSTELAPLVRDSLQLLHQCRSHYSPRSWGNVPDARWFSCIWF